MAAVACLLLGPTLDCFQLLQLLTPACKLASASVVSAWLGRKTAMFLMHELPMLEVPGKSPQVLLNWEFHYRWTDLAKVGGISAPQQLRCINSYAIAAAV